LGKSGLFNLSTSHIYLQCHEQVKIERNKPFVILYGDPKNVPNIIFHGTAKQYTIVESATVIVESGYFSAVNINFVS